TATRAGAVWQIAADEVVRFARQRNLPLPLVPRDRVLALLAPREHAFMLPTPGDTLIGRADEVASLVTLLEDPEVARVTLTGPGGVGKTRLALAVAEAMQGRLKDGVVFVDLSAVTRPSGAVPAIAQALGLREVAGQDQQRQITDFLRT